MHARSAILNGCRVGSYPCPALSPRTPANGHLSRFQVFSYVATLLYVVHAVFSLIRWKSS